MIRLFKRSFPKLDFSELIHFTTSTFKTMKELKAEIKVLNIRNDFLMESLKQKNRIIKMLEGERRSKLVRRKNIPKN